MYGDPTIPAALFAGEEVPVPSEPFKASVCSALRRINRWTVCAGGGRTCRQACPGGWGWGGDEGGDGGASTEQAPTFEPHPDPLPVFQTIYEGWATGQMAMPETKVSSTRTLASASIRSSSNVSPPGCYRGACAPPQLEPSAALTAACSALYRPRTPAPHHPQAVPAPSLLALPLRTPSLPSTCPRACSSI